MKFRITAKDLGIFIGFAVFLFYLCAIAISNIGSFGATGSFSGLNPMLGLTKYLGLTIMLFIVLIVVIISSVSSTIFERKKGFGFEIGEKDTKGYNRWAKDKEIKTDTDVEEVNPILPESKYAGIPLVNDGKRLWVDNGEYHNLVIGATGSGKSQTVVEPMVELLIKKGESMIITDPKGELYKASSDYLRERGYNVVTLNFRDPQDGNAWNPLTLPYHYYKDGNKDKAIELLDDVALNILYDPNNKGEPFWEKSAADYFSGLALGLFEDAKEDEINLNSINYMSTVGEDKFGVSNFIKEYFTMKGEASNAYVFASNTINSPTETKGGILSVFRQKIRLFASRENLSEMLSYSDFDMREIGKQKTAVFIVIQDEKTTYHSLATIFIKQMYETLIDVAQANGGKLPYRTNFILDEFANMPPLKDVTTMVTAARSRKVRFTFIIQNFAQLKSVYGNEDAETIKGNCGNLVYLISTELAALEEISKMCGEVQSGEKDKTASTPLVSVTDLQKLKLFEAIIIRWRKPPFKTKYTPNFKMDWGHPHSEATFVTRNKKDIKLFDVKTFVKEKKRENMLNSLNGENKSMGMMGDSPFGGGFGGASPFGGGASPFGGGVSPFGGSSPFGGGTNPFLNDEPRGSKPSSSSFGGLGGGLDLDAMMRDIDRKIAELDAEEAKQKEEMEKKKKEEEEKNKQVSEPKKDDISLFLEQEEANDKKDDSISSLDSEKEIKDAIISIPDNESNNEIIDVSNETGDINKANIAVATSSPIDEFDMSFDKLPKVEDADAMKPNYDGGTHIKDEDREYNIYNTVAKNEEKLKTEEPDTLEEDEEKTNVNIKPDDVKVPDNVISDDEFFDDFFGE